MQIDSTNKTILLVSDPHQEITKLRKIIAYEAPDFTIVGGDWFDSYTHDSNDEVKAACTCIFDNVFEDNFLTLMGNHDTQYLYDNRTTICSGYEVRKKNIITAMFGSNIYKVREKFRWFVWVDDFLFTHAGLHSRHLPPNLSVEKSALTPWLEEQSRIADNQLKVGDCFWVYGAGRARGGRQSVGGLNWLDFRYEFEPIDGLNQIVGHTSGKVIRGHHHDGNMNVADAKDICIDCRLNEYVIIQNKKLTVKRYADL